MENVDFMSFVMSAKPNHNPRNSINLDFIGFVSARQPPSRNNLLKFSKTIAI